jgi:ABC-type siderophore export system fused ATPase/permease subunit
MQRIERFLHEEEVPAWATTLKKHDIAAHQDMTGFVDAEFSWSRSSAPRFTLGPLNVAFPAGSLTLVSGATSSGKSALLAAMLGGESGVSICYASILTVYLQRCIA